jgi:hypothetical protein
MLHIEAHSHKPACSAIAALHQSLYPDDVIQIRSMKRLPIFALLWAMTLLTREPAAFDLRLGQRVYVDDGTCPQGQVKEVVGARLTPTGVERTRKCVPRNSIR